jgi:hypothetical protein
MALREGWHQAAVRQYSSCGPPFPCAPGEQGMLCDEGVRLLTEISAGGTCVEIQEVGGGASADQLLPVELCRGSGETELQHRGSSSGDGAHPRLDSTDVASPLVEPRHPARPLVPNPRRLPPRLCLHDAFRSSPALELGSRLLCPHPPLRPRLATRARPSSLHLTQQGADPA